MNTNPHRGLRGFSLLLLFAALAAQAQVNQPIGDLAPGKAVTLSYEVTINNPVAPGVTQIFHQGTVSGANFANVTTDDPETAAANDPTVTLLLLGADYTVTTTGNAIVVTDVAGNGDTLTVSEPSGGNIKFAAPGRTFSVDGGALITGDSGDLPLAVITGIMVNAEAGADILNVGAFTSPLPSLTLNGGTGDDTVNFSGDLTFGAGASLDVDLQNDDAAPGVDTVNVAANANLLTSGTGTITLKCSRNVSLAGGSSLVTADGNLTVEANQQIAPTAGSFFGVDVSAGLIQATGAGVVTVTGKGGDTGFDQWGVRVQNGGDIIGGTSGTVTVQGTGGAGSGDSQLGVMVVGAGTTITSSGGDVRVTGQGGGSGGSFQSIGVMVSLGGLVTSGTSGTVTVQGTGGAGSGGVQLGVYVFGIGATITSSGGAVQVTGIEGGGPSGVAIVGQNSGAITTAANGGQVTLIGNSMSFTASTTISAPAGSSVTLRPYTAGVGVDLGSTLDPIGGPLSLSDAELDMITAGTLVIGDANSGPITISAAISPANAAVLSLVTPDTIADTYTGGADVTVASLTTSGTLAPGASPGLFSVVGNETLTDNSTFAVEIGGATAGNGPGFHDQLSATGSVDIGANVTLNVTSYDGYGASAGETYVIIARTGGSGTFAGLLEGATVSPDFLNSGFPATISYLGGDGDDVVITVGLTATTTSLAASPNPSVFGQSVSFTATVSPDPGASGTVTFLDNGVALPGGSNVPVVGGVAVFSTSGLALGGHPITAQYSGGGGFAGSTSTPALTQTVNPVDYTVTTTGNAIVVTDVAGNGDTLAVSETSAGTIRFAAAGRAFSIDTVTFFIGDSGDLPLAGITSIIVNAAAGADTLNVGAFTSPLPSLTLNGGTGDDTVNFSGDLTFAANASLDVDLQDDDATPGIDAVNVAANANLLTSGTGTITVKCSRNIAVSAGGSLESVNGGITLEANQQAPGTLGNFAGVNVAGASALVTSSGTGPVTIKGRGGDGAGGFNIGIQLAAGGRVTSTGTGAVTLDGTGGTGSAGNQLNCGLNIRDAGSLVTTVDGNIHIIGQGGGDGTAAYQIGIRLFIDSQVTSTGLGTITLDGTGGLGAGADWGVSLEGSIQVASANSDIQITGQGGGAAAASSGYGVFVSTASTIAAGGAGTVTVQGTGGPGTGNSQIGVYVNAAGSTITSAGGNVQVTGQGGGTGIAANGYGVFLINGGVMTNGGSGTVTVQGTGGPGSGNQQYGVFLRNAGSTITSAGGSVQVTGQGGGSGASFQSIGVSVWSGSQVRAGGSGTVTVQGTGGPGSGANQIGVVVSDAGTKITSAGGDVQVIGLGGGTGASANDLGVDVQAAGQVSAGGLGTVTVQGFGGSGSGDYEYGVWVGGTDSTITSSGGAVQVTGTGGTGTSPWDIFLEAGGAIKSGANAPITVTADTLTIDPSGTPGNINSGTGPTTIQPRTAARPSNLGTDDSAGGAYLGLTDAELDLITCGTLVIGDANSGPITITDAISPANAATLILGTGATIGNTYAGVPVVTIPSLTTSGTLAPGASPGLFSVVGNHTLAANSSFQVEIGGTAPGTGYDQLSATGTVDIGANVSLNLLAYGGFNPSAGQTFAIISRTGGSGFFAGLPEGTPIANFLGSTLAATLSYAGGDGDDVVLTVGCLPAITVLNVNDAGSGSLRQAIADLCPGGTIDFAPALTGQTIVLTSGELVINKDLTITGLGADQLTVSGNNASRVFNVGAVTATLAGLTIADGTTVGTGGGGIYNAGDLVLLECMVIRNHSAVPVGPAIGGGGIYCEVGARTRLRGCTVDQNTAADVGAGVSNRGLFEAQNCTFSGNTNAANNGAGLWTGVAGSLALSNCTVTANHAAGGNGGGVRVFSGSSASLINTIVAGNSVAGGSPDVLGAVSSLGHNLIGTTNGSSGWVASDLVGNDDAPLLPLLGPLANNGGPTLTHALLPTSPAINTGDSAAVAALPFDQRGLGFPRVAGSTVDIGALESPFVNGEVTGRLYLDTNGNVTQDGLEPGLTNVVVYVTNHVGATVVAVTDANGDWMATVPPGLTIAKVDTADPNFLSQVAPVYQQTEGDDPTTVTSAVGVAVSAGNDGFTTQYVDGYVYQDSLMNGTVGQYDPGIDLPLPLVFVNITNSQGGVLVVVTDTNGYFKAFVPPGQTVVDVDQTHTSFPVGLVLTTVPDGQDPSTVTVPPSGSARDNTGYLRSSVTLASILSVTAHAEAGLVTVRWVAASEVGTVSYDLQRQLPDGAWMTVNADSVFAWNSLAGASYSVTDAGARARQSYYYQILEYLENGDTKRHGPYAVTVTGEPGVPVALSAVALAAGQLQLTWAGEAGATYLLEQSVSLAPESEWTEVPLTAPTDTSALVPVDGAAGFFRVFRLP